MLSTYVSYKQLTDNPAKTFARIAAEPTVSRDQAYYDAKIGTITSSQQFVDDYRLLSHAMQAFNLQDLGDAKAFMKKVLDSDLTDAKSFANTLSDTRYRAFAKAFQFNTKGAVVNTAVAQTSAQMSLTTARFAAASTGDAAAKTAATAYYTAHIATVTSVAALEKDAKLAAYVRTAYGLDATTSDATLASAMESDLSDAKSAANASGNTTLEAIAGAFNFAADGSVATRRQIQSAANITAATTAYTAATGTGTAAKAAAATETTYYTTRMPTITSLDQLLADKRVVGYIEKAYSIPTSTSTATLRAVLTSDLSSEKSVASKMGTAYRALAAAFDVSTTGGIVREPAQQAQTKASRVAVEDAYLEHTLETESGAQNPGVQLALYFRQKASTITSAYSILADKALTKVAHTLMGLSDSASNANIDAQAKAVAKKINLADLKDPVKLDKLIARFAVLYDLANATSTSTS